MSSSSSSTPPTSGLPHSASLGGAHAKREDKKKKRSKKKRKKRSGSGSSSASSLGGHGHGGGSSGTKRVRFKGVRSSPRVRRISKELMLISMDPPANCSARLLAFMFSPHPPSHFYANATADRAIFAGHAFPTSY